jgi:serine/threonine-protein kinase
VRIYDVGQMASGVPFMVMEYLRGRDLAAVLAEEGPLPVELAVEYAAQATMAISEAHEAGIIHRDLKPSNLFLTRRSDGSACIKVLDFGISKQLSMFDSQTLRADLTSTRQVMGSPAYMSPEQVRDARNVDHRTDIWALGSTLYELLTRHVAFDADTLPAVCAAIAADPPTPIETHRIDVPPQLAALVMRCLEKRPERRFPSARALLAALRGFQGRPDVLISAREPFKPSAARLVASPPASRNTFDSGTAPYAPAIKESGERQVAKSTPNEHVDGTLLSGRGATPGDPGATRDPNGALASEDAIAGRTKRRRRFMLLGLGLFGAVTSVVVALLWASSSLSEADGTFRLSIESEPAGAAVFEGNRRLGVTPIELPISRDSVSGKTRRFLLRKSGYRDAQLVQGTSTQNRQVQVNLAKESGAAATPADDPTAGARSLDADVPLPQRSQDDGDKRAWERGAATAQSTSPFVPQAKPLPRVTNKNSAAAMGSDAPMSTTPDIRTRR